MKNKLDLQFKEAFNKISKVQFEIAPDMRLLLYAYYKQATYGDNFTYDATANIISAFKINAWMQLKGMSATKAKQAYINLAETIINNKHKNL